MKSSKGTNNTLSKKTQSRPSKTKGTNNKYESQSSKHSNTKTSKGTSTKSALGIVGIKKHTVRGVKKIQSPPSKTRYTSVSDGLKMNTYYLIDKFDNPTNQCRFRKMTDKTFLKYKIDIVMCLKRWGPRLTRNKMAHILQISSGGHSLFYTLKELEERGIIYKARKNKRNRTVWELTNQYKEKTTVEFKQGFGIWERPKIKKPRFWYLGTKNESFYN
jgi:DNA-binding HxlR family transcriptional regulator